MDWPERLDGKSLARSWCSCSAGDRESCFDLRWKWRRWVLAFSSVLCPTFTELLLRGESLGCSLSIGYIVTFEHWLTAGTGYLGVMRALDNNVVASFIILLIYFCLRRRKYAIHYSHAFRIMPAFSGECVKSPSAKSLIYPIVPMGFLLTRSRIFMEIRAVFENLN